MKKIGLVLLVDDNADDNFFHTKAIQKSGVAQSVAECHNGIEALNFLLRKEESNDNYPRPDLIFLDINMPKMNGWEFLEEYEKLAENVKGGPVIVMLTTSINPRDEEKVKKYNVMKGFLKKPLRVHDIEKIMDEYFQ